jgi:RNA polymerase sigma factor (sigma-70 family)
LLVVRHQSRLRSFLARLAGPELCDDLAQEVFVKAWAKSSQFREESSYGTWLLGIAWTQFLDVARRNQSRNRLIKAAENLIDSTYAPSVEVAIDVQKMLASLSPIERVSLVLCEGEGWGHADASAILGLPLGTLKSIVARSKMKARRYFGVDES